MVTPTPVVVSCLLPSDRVTEDQRQHLTPVQRQELLPLLDEFGGWFSDETGRCEVAGRHIQTTANFVPRQTGLCRVPDAIESEFDCQTSSWFVAGLIRRSASPMVGIADRDIDVHMAGDYRHRERYKNIG